MNRMETAQELRRLAKVGEGGFPNHLSYVQWASETVPLLAYDEQKKNQFAHYLQYAANEN